MAARRPGADLNVPRAGRILIVDDDESVCAALARFLGKRGHEVEVASSGEEGLERAGRADLVFLDVRLPGMSGLEALERIVARRPGLPVVVVTAHGTMDAAVGAMRRGAYEYLTKPVDLSDVGELVARALEPPAPAREVAAAAGRIEASPGGSLVGSSALMQEVFKRIGAAASCDVPVLISGESGTGKELAARAIHAHSARCKAPFEPVNCATLPQGLLESELYGHEKGAFTGAVASKPGKVELAHGGTLFLDEVGEIPPHLQVKLLRFLEDRTFERVGGIQHRQVDVRVVAATNRQLRAAIAAGDFREDLYYRLDVFAIQIPPLRTHKEDIPELVAHFLGQRQPGISESALELVRSHDWPGNVRELRNAVEHACLLAGSRPIAPEHLPAPVRDPATSLTRSQLEVLTRELVDRLAADDAGGGSLHERVMEILERPLIARVLETTGGNQVQASARLGIHRSTLRKKIERYGL